MTTIEPGVYYLINKATGLYLDLQAGNSANGTLVEGWIPPGLDGSTDLTSHWLVQAVPNTPNNYTFRSLRGGTYLDLNGGSSANNTRVQGWVGDGSGRNQQWTTVNTRFPDFVGLQNVAGGTFLDLSGSLTVPGTPVIGYQGNAALNQAWRFERISFTTGEILGLCAKNPFIGPSFTNYIPDTMYIPLPLNLRNDIWRPLGFSPTDWRSKIWDCDDFSFAMKTAVAQWGRNYIRVNDIAIVFGVMFGEDKARGDRHAFNWYPTQNRKDIAFFEPQNGQETNTSNYNGYMAVF